MNDHHMQDVEELLNVPFRFTRQPDPISAMLRPERRVPLALLLVGKCHGSGASWKVLQLLSWAIRDERNIALIVALLNGRDLPDRPVVRFEPALDRALDLAVGSGYLEQKSARSFKLTPDGRRFVQEITSTSAFAKERELLTLIPGKLTKKDADRIYNWRTV